MSELVKQLRKMFNLPEDIASDEEILKATKGTMLRLSIELNLALRDLKATVMHEMITVREKLKKRMIGKK